MRMPLEEFGRSLMRVRANDHVGTHLIACIFDAALRDFFGLAERSAHADDCGLMFFGPRLPSGYLAPADPVKTFLRDTRARARRRPTNTFRRSLRSQMPQRRKP